METRRSLFRGTCLALLALALNSGGKLSPQADSAKDSPALYSQDFSQAKPGDVPENVMVLDGQFSVKEAGSDKYLELPGAPLETYGVLFGPSESAGFEVSAKIRGTRQGRKFPTFSLGANGVGGIKLRVAPAKRSIELLRGLDVDAVVRTAVAFEWKSGEWTHLKLRIRKEGAQVVAEGKVWHGEKEPADWTLRHVETEALPAGKAGVWGMPFSGSAIQFDDLRVTRIP